MEGPLSKWTNVVHGWQYRWFVLGEDALFYFTSKEKMLKGQQRGCLRLRGAVVGIDGESNGLFTITVDGKIFHLQGRDEKEKNDWVRALEASIRACSAYHTPSHAPEALKAQIAHANIHLKAISDQVTKVESIQGKVTSTADKHTVDELLISANRLMEVVGRAVVLLQMAESRIECNLLQVDSQNAAQSNEESNSTEEEEEKGSSTDQIIPPISYSSSDEEFYDAEDDDEETAQAVSFNSHPFLW